MFKFRMTIPVVIPRVPCLLILKTISIFQPAIIPMHSKQLILHMTNVQAMNLPMICEAQLTVWIYAERFVAYIRKRMAHTPFRKTTFLQTEKMDGLKFILWV